MLWPSRVSGIVDGAPLDTPVEALTLGLLVPILICLDPSFLCTIFARTLVVAILGLKIGAALTLQQEGWCLTFEPPKPMVRDSTGKPHAWDVRADWLADDPACSAVMTRSYRDTRELPVWFFNLTPPDDAPHRVGYGFGEILIRQRLSGYLHAPADGTFELHTGPATGAALTIDGRFIEPRAPGQHEILLREGTYAVRVEALLVSKDWPIIPKWNGREMRDPWFPTTTQHPPSAADLGLRPIAKWLLMLLVAAMVAAWLWAVVRRMADRALWLWTSAAIVGVSLAAIYVPVQAPRYAAAVMIVSLLVVIGDRVKHARGMFVMIGLPWIAYVAVVSVAQIGRWTLYGEGNDNFQFQRFAYRIFMQQYWLEGGQVTFWNQPLFRWIAGSLHLAFGDSSVGEAYWDAAGALILSMFAYRAIAALLGFTAGAMAAVLSLVMFLLGPALQFIGFGLSEISSAAFIYLAAWFAMRNRHMTDAIVAGILAGLGFYTRLNNLPMAVAVAAFALPLSIPAHAWRSPRAWLPLVQWRVAAAISGALAVFLLLFAWRTWYYTGVFSFFHGTQRDHLAVWKPDMPFATGMQSLFGSLLMVLTSADPPRLSWLALPLAAGAAISVAALAGVPGVRSAPLPLVVFFLAGCSSAFVTRGWAYEGRFSIHLFGAAAALCVWAVAAAARVAADRIWYSRSHPPGQVSS